MPELPEVEIVVQGLIEEQLIGKKITDAHVHWHRTIFTPKVSEFLRRIKGQIIKSIHRRGKWIVFSLSKDTLLVHLRMTGKFFFSPKNQETSQHTRVELMLNDGRKLVYEDSRKFGKWHLLQSAEKQLNEIGIEPLSKEFIKEKFQQIIGKHSQQIKPFLLNQKYIAGLGNIYVDEALWEAKIHPQRKVSSLKTKEINDLHDAIQKVLTKGIKNQGTTLGKSRVNYYSVSGRRGNNQLKLNVFRQEGLPCPRCGSIIVKTVVAQRGTHFCPQCQKA